MMCLFGAATLFSITYSNVNMTEMKENLNDLANDFNTTEQCLVNMISYEIFGCVFALTFILISQHIMRNIN